MSNGVLGKVHKIVYASKNFVSGLNNIEIKVLRPNGTIHSTGLMTEIAVAGFEGIYQYFLTTNSTDLEGEYIISIVSPNEGHKAKTKVTFRSESETANDISGIDLELNVNRSVLGLNTDTRQASLDISKIVTSLAINLSNIDFDVSRKTANIQIKTNVLQLNVDCCEG